MFPRPNSPERPYRWLGSWELDEDDDDEDRCWLDQFLRSVLSSPGGREGSGLSAGGLKGPARCSSPTDCKLGIGWRLYWDNNPGQTISVPELLQWSEIFVLFNFVLSPFQDMLSCLFWLNLFSHSLTDVHTGNHKVTATIGQDQSCLTVPRSYVRT